MHFCEKKASPTDEGFVDDEDVGIDVGDDRERESDYHPARIGLDRLIDEVADIGEGGDVVEALPRSAGGSGRGSTRS